MDNVLAEALWTLAFCAVIAGGAWSYRSNGAWPAVWVLIAAALLDVATVVLPGLGVEALSYPRLGPKRTNAVNDFANTAGLIAYVLLIAGIALRWRKRLPAFHATVALMQVVWFLSFIGYLYALYIVPDAIRR